MFGKLIAGEMLPTMVIALGTLSIIYTALMVGLLYRKLRRQQV